MKEMILLEMRCPFCGRNHQLIVDAESFEKYQQGALVQEAFPHMNPTDREKLITQMCEPCQDKMFGFDNLAD